MAAVALAEGDSPTHQHPKGLRHPTCKQEIPINEARSSKRCSVEIPGCQYMECSLFRSSAALPSTPPILSEVGPRYCQPDLRNMYRIYAKLIDCHTHCRSHDPWSRLAEHDPIRVTSIGTLTHVLRIDVDHL